MGMANELVLAIGFTTFLVAVVFPLTLLWWHINRSDRPVAWLFASDAVLLAAVIAFFLGDRSDSIAPVIVLSGLTFHGLFGFLCLARMTTTRLPRGPVVLAGAFIVGVQVHAYAGGGIDAAAVAVSATLGLAMIAAAVALFVMVRRSFNGALATVMMAPFAGMALVHAVHLGAILNAPATLGSYLTAAVVLGFGFNSVNYLFCLAHLRNNIDATDLTSARISAEVESEAKSDFMRVMSHELRTPLNAIIGFSELMRNARYARPELFAQNAEHIHAAGVYLLDMVNDLLELAKIEAGKLEIEESDFSANALIDEVELLTAGRAAAAGLTLTTAAGEVAVMLRADRRRIMQALLNLVTNAIKFTEPDGGVRLTAGTTRAGDWVVRVEDEGIGMTREEIRTALQPFGQNQRSGAVREGLGIGLPISADFLAAHGGSLRIESVPGRGTIVTATLPASRVRLAAQPAAAPARSPSPDRSAVIDFHDARRGMRCEQTS